MWFFTSPKIAFGEDSLEQLSTVEGKRVLVITDPVVRKLGMVEALADGPAAGKVPDLSRQLKEYYALRGWDPTTGHPTKERLRALGIESLSAYLTPRK